MMTRKHFNALAAKLREANEAVGKLLLAPDPIIKLYVNAVIEAVADDNPRFDDERFRAACTPDKREDGVVRIGYSLHHESTLEDHALLAMADSYAARVNDLLMEKMDLETAICELEEAVQTAQMEASVARGQVLALRKKAAEYRAAMHSKNHTLMPWESADYAWMWDTVNTVNDTFLEEQEFSMGEAESHAKSNA